MAARDIEMQGFGEGNEETDRLVLENFREGDIRRHPEEAVVLFLVHADELLHAPVTKQFILSIIAGMFITFGAALSVFLSFGVDSFGPRKLLLGFGFAGGFSLVILSGSALFTEINVLLPDILLFSITNLGECKRRAYSLLRIFKFWLVCYVGNITGALTIGCIAYAIDMFKEESDGESLREYLHEVVDQKVAFTDPAGRGWFQVVLSAMLGNLLVGLAAFFASQARTIMGKLLGLYFPVTTFAVLGVQHSPANMGYLFLSLLQEDTKISWFEAIFQNLLPASLGNLLGGMALSLCVFYFVFGPDKESRENICEYLDEKRERRASVSEPVVQAAEWLWHEARFISGRADNVFRFRKTVNEE